MKTQYDAIGALLEYSMRHGCGIDRRDHDNQRASEAVRDAPEGLDDLAPGHRREELRPVLRQEGCVMDIKIEQGVPIPARNRKGGGLTATLKQMIVGDSFLWPKAKRGYLTTYFQKVPEAKFTSRTVDEENVRVWRVE